MALKLEILVILCLVAVTLSFFTQHGYEVQGIDEHGWPLTCLKEKNIQDGHVRVNGYRVLKDVCRRVRRKECGVLYVPMGQNGKNCTIVFEDICRNTLEVFHSLLLGENRTFGWLKTGN